MSSASEKEFTSTIAPYGTWGSPISARSVGSGDHVFELKLYGEEVYFVEVRPREEKARYSVMRIGASGGRASEMTPPPFNARTTVHEYGGGAFLLAREELIFSHFDDQRLYVKTINTVETPIPLTLEGTDSRFADGIFDDRRNRIVCVRELHPAFWHREAINSIVSIDLKEKNGGNGSPLLSGNDFYAYPRVSSDGSKLAWITWNFPNMPFDGSELWVGEFDSEGTLQNKKKIAGGLDESVTQPRWSYTGSLYFISDRTGWWNLYRWKEDNGVSAICPKNSDFCQPDWNLGLSTYSFVSRDQIFCTYADEGEWRLATIDTKTSRFQAIASDFTEIKHVQASSEGFAIFLAGSHKDGNAIYRYELGSNKISKIYEPPGGEEDRGFTVLLPVSKTLRTANNVFVHGFYYEPSNPKFKAPEGDLPPLIVMVHGGPTHASTNAMRGTIQFFASRGFAVLDVNYGGSSAYGREYRRRLNGQWGIVDVEDCVNGALSLAKEGKIDKDRVVIRGGSAGGWTTLCALAFRDFFKAGACYYGISELERWELDCHKFESQYLHSLIGSYPQERELYLDRSPASHADNFSAPVIVFQGLEDKVVPPTQSELMVQSLRERNKTVEYFPFEGEQHDFRQARHIEESLNRELEFFKKALRISGT